jgi:leucyl-tRNA synthetase
VLVQLLSPLAPHVAEELWRELGHKGDEVELGVSPWPVAEPVLVIDDAYQMAVQVNGKLRGEVQVAASADDAEIRDLAARDPKVAGWLQGKTVKKVVVVPKRLVNFVVA